MSFSRWVFIVETAIMHIILVKFCDDQLEKSCDPTGSLPQSCHTCTFDSDWLFSWKYKLSLSNKLSLLQPFDENIKIEISSPHVLSLGIGHSVNRRN